MYSHGHMCPIHTFMKWQVRDLIIHYTRDCGLGCMLYYINIQPSFSLLSTVHGWSRDVLNTHLCHSFVKGFKLSIRATHDYFLMTGSGAIQMLLLSWTSTRQDTELADTHLN